MWALVQIHPIQVGPDNTLPGIPAYPDQGLPGGRPPGIWGGAPTYPDQGLPPFQGRPDQGLPGSQPGIDNTLPGVPARPDQGLPPGVQPKAGTAVAGPPPAQVDANHGMWVLVAVQGKYVWAWAQQTQPAGSGGSPDNTLPGSQPGVDNTLPGGVPPQAGQLPGQTPQPKK